MHVVDQGTGVPVLLLHPFPFDGRFYANVAPRIATFARCLVVDLPGFGLSRGHAPTSLDDHAHALVQLLDDRGIDRIALGGLSFGGYLALAFARLFPARLGGLILASTRATADTPAILQQRAHADTLTRSRGVHALVAHQLPTWLSRDASFEARDAATTVALSQPPNAVLAGIAAMRARPDSTPLLATLQVPTTILSGTDDTLTRPVEMEQLRAIPHSVFRPIEQAAHLFVLTHPDAFVDGVRTTVEACSLRA